MSTHDKIFIKVDADLKDIIPGFLERRKQDIPSLWDSLKKKDFSTLQTMGHRLKGNAGGYGFDQLGQLGAIIEDGAKAKNIAEIEPAIKQIEHYLYHVEIVFE